MKQEKINITVDLTSPGQVGIAVTKDGDSSVQVKIIQTVSPEEESVKAVSPEEDVTVAVNDEAAAKRPTLMGVIDNVWIWAERVDRIVQWLGPWLG